MLIGVACACGEQINVMDVYAGGHVRCPKCGDMVHVEGDYPDGETKIRFACPHCQTRVVARKKSVGKHSRCPSCQRTYVVPEPIEAPDAFSVVERKRIELDIREIEGMVPLALGVGRMPTIEMPTIPEKPVRPTNATTGELRVRGAEHEGRTIPLNFSRFIVGRDKDCDLRLQGALVSRHHCVFKRDEFTLRVRDLGSRNGTTVNQERIQGEVVLHHDDEVTVGDVTLKVDLPYAAPVKPNGADTDLSISDFVII